jgi:pre-mRNA-splicing factor 38A
MDEFVDQLLRDERVCDIILPRIAKREVLEESGELGPRKSLLLDAMEGKEESERGRSLSRSRSRSGSVVESEVGYRSRSGSVSTDRRGSSRSRSPSDAGSRYVSKSPSRSVSPDRMPVDE